ncbi:hypothetical protein, variant [Aphanomyces invadans]|uniref:Uncharacterized protein n=1 Tax=Aphanomyces invadans TaxID=157072 RepID=A0A024U886_9STRA|nr:hypothetical protein, variant [Aphanomyces invadans]ETW01808.1 hypothetical protein, variant [Aphanomyces invadans]|eukprot:XP_008869656.1 hypothetical protein, variant [Aphanomyces invadans]
MHGPLSLAAALLALLPFNSLVSCSMNDAIVLDAPVLPVVMGTVLDAYKPLLAEFAKKSLPATVGNCSDSNPPTPCMDTGYLLAQTSALYDIKARWITGINAVNVGNLEYAADVATVCALMLASPANAQSSQMERLRAAAVPRQSPSPPKFRAIEIRPSVELQFPVNGKPTTLFDVTKPVESGLNATAAAFIQKEGMDLLNSQIKELFGTKVYCTQQAKDAATKAPTAVPSSTASPESSSASPPSPSSSSSGTSSPNADAPATSVPSRTSPVPASAAVAPIFSVAFTLVFMIATLLVLDTC